MKNIVVQFVLPFWMIYYAICAHVSYYCAELR